MQQFVTQSFQRFARFLVAAGVLGLAALGGSAVAVNADEAGDQQISVAVTDYLRAERSPLAEQTTVVVTDRDGAYARLLLTPAATIEADPAIAFAQEVNGQWTVLSLGTAFTPEDCAALNIPAALPCAE